MLSDDLFHDRQSNSGSGLAGLFGPSGSIELLENAADFFFIHPDSLIFHGEANGIFLIIVSTAQRDAHSRVGW